MGNLSKLRLTELVYKNWQ